MRKIVILFSVLLMAAAGPLLAGGPEETSPAPQAKAASGCPHAAQAAKAGCQKAAKKGCEKAAKADSGCCKKGAAAKKSCSKAAAKKECCKKAGVSKNCPKKDTPAPAQEPAKN
jgi:hypothetical protein